MLKVYINKQINPCSIIKTSFRDSKNCNISPFALSIMHLPHIYCKNVNKLNASII